MAMKLLIPKFEQEVTVIGEVQNVTSHLYKPNLTRDNYIAMSGGMTRRADTGRIYVVRAQRQCPSSTKATAGIAAARSRSDPATPSSCL